ncbi:MAG: DUF2059 domain-containing protein, partial [Promethearchaeota archaeon]
SYKKGNIKKLLELSGAKNIAMQSINFMMQTYKEHEPEVYEILAEKIDLEELIEDIFIFIYEKHFSDYEIKELIQFYESPIGKKLLSISPKIFQEASLMAQERIERKLDEFMG